MAEGDSKRYHVPTHLRMNDLLTFAGFTFTFRQVALLLGGGGAAFSVGTQFPHSVPGLWVASLLGVAAAQGVQWCLVGLLLVPTLVLAFVRFQGRTLESWCLLWLRYRAQLRHFHWRQQSDPTLTAVSPGRRTIRGSEDQAQ
jgi:hypothetical protein